MEGDDGGRITNPPYGERIGDRKAVDHIEDVLSRTTKTRPTWSLFIITPDRDAEKKIRGGPADRRRKLYNGRIEVCYYQFHGKKKEKKQAGNGSVSAASGD